MPPLTSCPRLGSRDWPITTTFNKVPSKQYEINGGSNGSYWDILHHRGHLNAFLFILAILIWPLALIASLMLPLDYWNRTPTWNRTATYGYAPVTKVTSDSHIAQ